MIAFAYLSTTYQLVKCYFNQIIAINIQSPKSIYPSLNNLTTQTIIMIIETVARK